MSDIQQFEAEDGEPQGRKITLEFFDAHAPGITRFLRSLPARTETAFIRGLIYQWMLNHQASDDYERRLLDVLNGPGGRSMHIVPGANAQSRPLRKLIPRPPAPAPRKQAQTVMPLGDAPRHQVSNRAAKKVVPPVILEPTNLPIHEPSQPPEDGAPVAVPAAVSPSSPPPAIPSPAPQPQSKPIADAEPPESEVSAGPVEFNAFDGQF